MDERVLPAGLREQQLASRRIPAWLRIAIFIPCAAAAVYFIATFTGPYRYAALLEVRIFGGTTYTVQIAALSTLLVCLLPALFATVLLRRLFPPTAQELSRPPRATARENRR